MMKPQNFSSGGGASDSEWGSHRTESTDLSYVSLKSSNSMFLPPDLSGGSSLTDPSGRDDLQVSRCGVCNDLQVSRKSSRTHPVLLAMEQDSKPPVDDVLHRVLQTHRTSMKSKYESFFEGVKTQENRTLLNRVYTQLYITEGESERVNEEHEVLQMQKALRKQPLRDIPINFSDIFKPIKGHKRGRKEKNIRAVMAEGVRHTEPEEDEGPEVSELRTVLTKGIAGIGKTVSVQKFILDWAEGKANQDVDFMFVLPFRELNLIRDDQYNVHRLVCDFHPEIKYLDPKVYDVCRVVFIFDGLDESKIPLNFHQCDITMASSVGALISNLIKGELLPSAHIWITSRPAATNQIPPQYITRVTEIQGFTDPQKEEYFRKRVNDPDQAEKIISHIKTAKSLHIMCHIPVFCWIAATVLQQKLKQTIDAQIPKTLTDMYIQLLHTQIDIKNEKYVVENEKDQRKQMESSAAIILELAKLAFKQLMKGNVLFYEEDLRESGIDVTEASVYSGICTEIFREESVLYHKKVYCFVHLSFQEFLAALYVFHCYVEKNMEVLKIFLHGRARSLPEHIFVSHIPTFQDEDCMYPDVTMEAPKPRSVSYCYSSWSENVHLNDLLKAAVCKALENPNGHLDLFLRFILGISLESNQRLLQGLLLHTLSSLENINETVQYIKDKIQRENLPNERSINLFLCLTEMKNQSLSREIQEYLQSERHSGQKLSPGQCSVLACMFLTSEQVLDELDLKKFNTSKEGYRRLIPAMANCRKALLCNLNADLCRTVYSTLASANSPVKELYIDNYNLQVEGMKLIPHVPKSSYYKLKTLSLAMCNLGQQTCEILRSAIQLHNSSLRELDLSNNDLQDSGVKQLSAGLESSHCKLEILRLSGCLVTEEGCSSLASALSSNPSHLKELDLTYNHPGESGVKVLSARLEDPHCRLNTLRVDHAGKIRIKSGLRKYACELTLDPNTAHKHLSLSEANRKVMYMEEHHSYPDHPERFDGWEQVLCRESLSGRCYWEAEWSGGAAIAVTYKGIGRKGHSSDCVFGGNVKSWRLYCSDNSYSVLHNKVLIDTIYKKETVLPAPTSSSNRVGVYLDWPAGTLSFYSISSLSHTLTHLHTVYSTFTEPLYAGFGVGSDSSVSVCELE